MDEPHEAMGGGLDIKSRELHGYADGAPDLADGTELLIRVTGVTATT